MDDLPKFNDVNDIIKEMDKEENRINSMQKEESGVTIFHILQYFYSGYCAG